MKLTALPTRAGALRSVPPRRLRPGPPRDLRPVPLRALRSGTWRVPATVGILLLTASACSVHTGPPGLGTPTGDDRGDVGQTATDGTDSAGVRDLDGRSLVSTRVTGHELVAGSTVRMTFEDTQLSVQAGCNTIFGAYALQGGVLRAAELAQTEMGCAADLMEQDQWLVDFLQGGPRLTQTDQAVVLSGDGVEMELTDREVVSPDLALEGQTWVLTTSYTETATTSIRGMENASLVLDGGDVRLDTGCNTGGGSYTLEGDTVSLSPLRLTLRACEDLAMEVEQVMMAVLQQEDLTVEVEADRLTLTAPDGTALGFTAAVTSDGSTDGGTDGGTDESTQTAGDTGAQTGR